MSRIRVRALARRGDLARVWFGSVPRINLNRTDNITWILPNRAV